jgi:hypothetical protein
MIKIAKIITICLIALNLIAGYVLSQEQINIDSKDILGASSAPVFNPNYVMSDWTFSAKNVFPTEQSVQNYLSNINSPLARYNVQGKSASYWIFAAATGQTSSNYGIKPNINPAVMLAFLEKEQSLLGAKNYDIVKDPEVKLKWAMGMGCPDEAKCGSEYAGFVNQVNWGAFQLQLNFERATKSNWDKYQVNNNIRTLDGYDVYLSNSATAAAYRYTPHVYWGNYSLWKIITANGWGVSGDTYSYAVLDAANLKNKDKPIVYDNNSNQNDAKTLKLEATVAPKTYTNPTPVTSKNDNVNVMTLPWQRTNNNNCSNLKLQSYQEGETSERVKQLQLCMQKEGYFAWKYGATGYFGSVTKQALIRWRGYF